MKVVITIYDGSPFSVGFPSRRTKTFPGVEELKRHFQLPAYSDDEFKPLATWLEIADGSKQGQCCWLEDLFAGKDFHSFNPERDAKTIRLLGEHREWVLQRPDGVIVGMGYRLALQPHENVSEGKYFITTPSGVTATAECKKPNEESLVPSMLQFLTTSLD
jgi:hypothetical protein